MGPLQVSLTRAIPAIAASLQIPEKTEVIVRHQNGYVDGLPWQRQTSYYPRSLDARAPRLLETSNINEGVVAYLAGLGVEQCGYRDEIAWRTPDERGVLLRLPADGHIQVVEIRRITFDQNGNRVRLTVTIWRADRNQFVINVGEVPPTARNQT